MSKNRSLAFQYYPRDTLTNPDVAAMTLEEFGAYWTLISYMWLEGSLPYDKKKLAKILRISPKKFLRLWPAMEKLFKIEGDKITHPGLDEIRAKQIEWSINSALGGQKSAQKRLKGGSNLVQTKREPSDNSSSSSSLSTLTSHTQPTSPSSNDEKATMAVCDTNKSKFSVEERKEYCNAHLRKLTNPEGWMIASASGRFDEVIEEWVRKGKPIRKSQLERLTEEARKEKRDDPSTTKTATLDITKCPDCHGKGLIYEERGSGPYSKGMARYHHKKLHVADEG